MDFEKARKKAGRISQKEEELKGKLISMGYTVIAASSCCTMIRTISNTTTHSFYELCNKVEGMALEGANPQAVIDALYKLL